MCTRVLIVAQDPEWQQRLAAVVSGSGDLSVAGVVGPCCQDLLCGEGRPVDVVVLDLHLAGAQGIAYVRHATRCHPATPVLVLCETDADPQVWDAIEAGAAGCLLRHCGGESLCQAIHDAKAGGSPMSPDIARCVLARVRQGLHDAHADVSASGMPPIAMTLREAEVLRLLAQGLSFEDMGRALFVSRHTVVAHVKHIYRKLAVHSRAQAVYTARQARLL